MDQLQVIEKLLPVRHANTALMLATAQAVLQSAREVVIDSQVMYEIGRDELGGIKTQRDAIDAARMERTRPLDAAKKELMDEVREPLKLYDEAVEVISGAMKTWVKKCDDERREAQRLADEVARQERERQAAIAAAEAEKQRQVEAEQARQAAEMQAKDKEARKQREAAERAAAAGDVAAAETARRAAQAAKEAADQAAIAADYQQEEIARARAAEQAARLAPPVTSLVVESPMPAKGAGVRRPYKAECFDEAALFAFCATHPEYRNLWKLDASALNSEAKAKRELLSLPGVRVYEDLNITGKRR